jgi:hypothetical protein
LTTAAVSNFPPEVFMKTKKQQQILRQGDVLLIPTTKAPAVGKEIPREAGRIVLAHGEVTGHSHAIPYRHAKLFNFKDSRNEDRLLRVDDGGGGSAKLVHEEHGTIDLPAGDYVIRIQIEWNDEEARRVED